MHRAMILLAAAVAAATAATAQADTPCKPPTFQPDVPNPIPDGFSGTDQPTLIDAAGKPITGDLPPVDAAAKTFSVSAAALLMPGVRLKWDKPGESACVQTPGSAATPPAGIVLKECITRGTRAARDAHAARRGRGFTVLLLSDEGVCYANRHFSAEGDPLYVGYIRQGGAVAALKFDKCEAPSAIPKVLVGGDISSIKTESLRDGIDVQWFLPVAQCFGTSVELHLTKGGTKFVSATLTQYERYRATLQVGAAFTTRHIETFSLRSEGDKKFIVRSHPDPEDRGPEYTASVVIYGVPRYFMRPRLKTPNFLPGPPVVTRDPYFGRDPIQENGLVDRLGLLIGVGLTKPERRFLVGGTLELVTGVNAFVAHEFVRLSLLNGVAAGDEFKGEAKDIPLKDDWDTGWVFGLSFDARYALALFGKK